MALVVDGGGGSLLSMLSDRDQLGKAALILLACVQAVDVHTYAHVCLKKKKKNCPESSD